MNKDHLIRITGDEKRADEAIEYFISFLRSQYIEKSSIINHGDSRDYDTAFKYIAHNETINILIEKLK